MIKQKVLIVDDQEKNRIALLAILDDIEVDVVEAASGNEALGYLLKDKFAVVLLDVQMPDMDGFEVAELMRQNKATQQTPIIFVTAINKDQQYVFRGYEVGAIDYLFKPLDSVILKSKVSTFLEWDKSKQQLEVALVKNKSLQEQNERILKSIGEGVVCVDMEGIITYANPAARSMLSVDEPLGSHCHDFMMLNSTGSPLINWRDSPLRQRTADGECFRADEDIFFMLGADPAPVEITATPILDKKGESFGAVIVFRDISVRKINEAKEIVKQRREIIRKTITLDLTVFNRNTGENVGRLVNITESGLKVHCKKSVDRGDRFEFGMILPEPIQGSSTISFDAVNIWCREAAYSKEYYAGFKMMNLDVNIADVIEELVEKY